MGTTKPVSNDIRLSNAIKQYFASLGKFLCIEPSNISIESQPDIVFDNVPPQREKFEKIKTSNDNNDDTEDENEAPELV